MACSRRVSCPLDAPAAWRRQPPSRRLERDDSRATTVELCLRSCSPFTSSLSVRWFHAEQQTGYGGTPDAQVVEEQGGDQGGQADHRILHQRSDVPLHHVEADDHDDRLVQDIDRQDSLVGVADRATAQGWGALGWIGGGRLGGGGWGRGVVGGAPPAPRGPPT